MKVLVMGSAGFIGWKVSNSVNSLAYLGFTRTLMWLKLYETDKGQIKDLGLIYLG